MKLNILEKRKMLNRYWIFKGTKGSKAFTITDNQVLAIYAKYEEDIQDMLDLEELYSHAGDSLSSEKDQWSDREWEDYAFEEAM